MILVVDNYDSFVHNLARYVRLAGRETIVVRNDSHDVEELLSMRPEGVVMSPGPKSPKDAGVCLPLLDRLSLSVPVLGVCLGHQCLIEAFGGWTARALRPLHGESSPIRHDATGLFAGLPSPIEAARYHSLIATLPDNCDLIANAWSEEGEVMGVRHRTAPWFGVQFHPESVLTSCGRDIVRAFAEECGK